jgi:hypothetical protein
MLDVFGPVKDRAADLGASMPHTLFAVFEFDSEGTEPLRDFEAALAEACEQLGMSSSQVIILARGPAAGLALDAALLGAHPLCGVVVLDPPTVIAATAARWRGVRVRILQNESADPGGLRLVGLTKSLHALEVDVRCLLLPSAADDAVVVRATQSFLAELTACASRAGEWRTER